MLFTIEKPDTPGIYWLDRVLSTFFQNLFAEQAYDNGIFPAEFIPVLEDSAVTYGNFRDVHKTYNELELEDRQSFQAIYNNHRNLIRNLADENYQVTKPTEALSDIWTAVKALGVYLYQTTINLACYKNLPHVNDNMSDHFAAFKTTNGKVCCFCGMEFYEAEREINEDNGEVQWRASYDHYLYKKQYPLNSVDFDNLFPCCHPCNEKAKDQKDIAHNENQRVPAFHPYLDAEVASVEVTYSPQNRRWTVALPPGNTLLNKKIQNWDRIFLVTSRASRLINDSFEETWFAPVALGKTNATEIRYVVQGMSVICNERVRVEREAYYKAKCFQIIFGASDAELEVMTATVNDLYAGRVI